MSESQIAESKTAALSKLHGGKNYQHQHSIGMWPIWSEGQEKLCSKMGVSDCGIFLGK